MNSADLLSDWTLVSSMYRRCVLWVLPTLLLARERVRLDVSAMTGFEL